MRSLVAERTEHSIFVHPDSVATSYVSSRTSPFGTAFSGSLALLVSLPEAERGQLRSWLTWCGEILELTMGTLGHTGLIGGLICYINRPASSQYEEQERRSVPWYIADGDYWTRRIRLVDRSSKKAPSHLGQGHLAQGPRRCSSCA